MKKQCEMSRVTVRYLARYYEILDAMIQGMTKAELTKSVSHNFIVQMIPHHEAAIEMSQNILQYTTLLPVQKIASNIIEAQTQSIKNLTEALPCCAGCENTSQEAALYERCYRQITQEMFHAMETARASNSINENFLHEMIPHHMGAIQMSANTRRFPICEELKPILHAIITSQQAGVEEMRRLLRCF